LKRQPIKTGILSQIFNACPDLQHASTCFALPGQPTGWLFGFIFCQQQISKKKVQQLTKST
jgi:hypothetical protein